MERPDETQQFPHAQTRVEGGLLRHVRDPRPLLAFELPEGTSVLLPPGVPHAASNRADVPLELLELYVPASELPDFEIVEDR